MFNLFSAFAFGNRGVSFISAAICNHCMEIYWKRKRELRNDTDREDVEVKEGKRMLQERQNTEQSTQ